MLTSNLTGRALDYAVALARGHDVAVTSRSIVIRGPDPYFCPLYHKDWAEAGPIIEWKRVNITFTPKGCVADNASAMQSGPTPLIAGMRCVVASELGDEVNVPEELL